MAMIAINYEVSAELVKLVQNFHSEQHPGLDTCEIAIGMTLAAFSLLSVGMNDVQFREAICQVAALTAPLRQKNAS